MLKANQYQVFEDFCISNQVELLDGLITVLSIEEKKSLLQKNNYQLFKQACRNKSIETVQFLWHLADNENRQRMLQAIKHEIFHVEYITDHQTIAAWLCAQQPDLLAEMRESYLYAPFFLRFIHELMPEFSQSLENSAQTENAENVSFNENCYLTVSSFYLFLKKYSQELVNDNRITQPELMENQDTLLRFCQQRNSHMSENDYGPPTDEARSIEFLRHQEHVQRPRLFVTDTANLKPEYSNNNQKFLV